MPGQLPQEVRLTTGDLISVLAPRDARLRVVGPSGKDAAVVVPLEAARYQLLSTQGRGTVPVELSAAVYPKSLAWQHFGAAEPGLVYLDLSEGKSRGLVRVRVVERPPLPRSMDLVWSDTQQQEANASPARVRLHVAMLPGAAEDELMVRRADGAVYRFMVRPRPVPAC